ISVKIAMPRPVHFHASSAKMPVVSSMDRKLKKSSSALSTMVIGTCADRKTGRKFGTSQPRTKSLTQSSNGMMRRTAGLSMSVLLCLVLGFVGGNRCVLTRKLGEDGLWLDPADQ